VNVWPILRRAALAAAGTGAAAALVLGPSTPSSAAAIPVVTTTNQAGYLVGGNNWNFRIVQEVINLPATGCTGTNNHTNFRNSGVQLIGGGTNPGKAWRSAWRASSFRTISRTRTSLATPMTTRRTRSTRST
jgi:hypothetical protein